jgi:hypothetical protein
MVLGFLQGISRSANVSDEPYEQNLIVLVGNGMERRSIFI